MDACCRPGMEDNRKKDFTDKTFLFIRQKTTAKKKKINVPLLCRRKQEDIQNSIF